MNTMLTSWLGREVIVSIFIETIAKSRSTHSLKGLICKPHDHAALSVNVPGYIFVQRKRYVRKSLLMRPGHRDASST